MFQNMNKKLFRGLSLAIVLAMLIAPLALADNVKNDVVAGGNDTIAAGGSTTIKYWIQPTGGTCDAADGSVATVTINVPSDVTATPSSLVFSACNTSNEANPNNIQSVVLSSSVVGDYSITASVSDTAGSYNASPASFTLHVLAAPPPTDSTPPIITANVSGTLGNNGWYTSDVAVTWIVEDNESAISSSSGCDPTAITTDTAGTTLTCSATSAGGTSSESVTFKRDATAPTLAPSVTPNPILLNGSATANPSATDATSGIASESCGAVDTSSVGSKSVSCTATDNAGNINSASASYSVQYGFAGFFAPVDNNGVLNVAKAGQAIPLKWRLLDANNDPVTNLASVGVTVASLSCPAGTTGDLVEEYAAGSSGLQNLGDGYYQWNWKSPTSYANSCKTLNLNLGEGSPRSALFQFKK